MQPDSMQKARTALLPHAFLTFAAITLTLCFLHHPSYAQLSSRGASHSIEDVMYNPKQYSGKTLTFHNVTILGKLARDGRVTMVDVTSEDGAHVPPRMDPDRVSFTLKSTIADKMANQLDPLQKYKVRLTCRIRKIRSDQWRGLYWIAEISNIQFYTPPSTRTDTREITVEKVLANPKRYSGRTVTFHNLLITGGMRRDHDFLCFEVMTYAGTKTSTIWTGSSLTFYLRRGGEKEHIRKLTDYRNELVSIRCKIRRPPIHRSDRYAYWGAEVISITKR